MTQERNLFDELMDGVGAMRDEREGKLTLRTAEIGDLPPLAVDATLIRETREQMNCSRAVFARRLRVSPRTLEAWEQGRARPNAQAAALTAGVGRSLRPMLPGAFPAQGLRAIGRAT